MEFWLANFVGGTPATFSARWFPSDTDPGQTFFDLIDPGAFGWTLYTFGPLPATGSGSRLQFVFRQDPDFFFLDDVDVEPIAAASAHHTDRGHGLRTSGTFPFFRVRDGAAPRHVLTMHKARR